MEKVSKVDWAAFTLLIIGGLNTGLFGLFNLDIIHIILKNFPVIERLFLAIIGASAIYAIFRIFKIFSN